MKKPPRLIKMDSGLAADRRQSVGSSEQIREPSPFTEIDGLSRRPPASGYRAMIHVHELTKHYCDLRRGRFVALDGISFHARPGTDLRPVGSQRCRQDHHPANPQHRARPTGGSATVDGSTCSRRPPASGDTSDSSRPTRPSTTA